LSSGDLPVDSVVVVAIKSQQVSDLVNGLTYSPIPW